MKRVIAVIALLSSTACVDAVLGTPAVDRAAIFDDLWQEVDRRYPFLEYKSIDWTSVGEKYRAQAVSAASDDQFAETLGRMLAELRDVHVTLTPSSGVTKRYVADFERAPTYFDESATMRLVPGYRYTPGGQVWYGMAAANVGYVRIPTFRADGIAAAMDDALRALPNARAYVERLEELSLARVSAIGVGPGRDETIVRHSLT